MIQRKQTLFLAASVVLFLTTFGFPFGMIGTNALHNYKVMSADGTAVEGISTYHFSIPLAIASLISGYAIFLYNNRQRQMAVVRVTFIFYAASFALMSMYIMDAAKVIADSEFSLGISFFLPFASFFCNLIAMRGIKKDEQLIKSLDRLR
jgi:D-alanyl-lipoteichoic acid acyltransferase DltB (MBOAT superfamily)